MGEEKGDNQPQPPQPQPEQPQSQSPQPQQIQQPQPTQGKKGNSLGVAGFVLGLLSVLLFWISLISWPLAITGVVLSGMQIKKQKTGLAVAGLVLSIIGVLLPLIVIAAVTLIWAAVIPSMQDQLSEGAMCLDAVSQIGIVDDGTTCVTESGDLNLKIKRGAKDFELSKIKVLISHEGSTWLEELSSDLPGPDGEATFHLTNLEFPTIHKVQIAPVIMTSEGEKNCDVSATLQINKC